MCSRARPRIRAIAATPAVVALALGACGGALHGVPAPRPFDAAERSAWLHPTRWGLDGALEPSVDRAVLGPRTVYLAFEPIPTAARALLVLTPVDRGTAIVILERTSDGAELARVPIVGSRPAWIQLPSAARHELAIRAAGSIAIATPLHADPAARPRIELTLEPTPAAPGVSTADAR